MEDEKSVTFIANTDWKKTDCILYARYVIYIISYNPTGILQNRYHLYLTAEKSMAKRWNDSPNVTQRGYVDSRPDRSSWQKPCVCLLRMFWLYKYCLYWPGIHTLFLRGLNSKYLRLCGPHSLCCTHTVKCKSSHRHSVNRWVRMFSNKTRGQFADCRYRTGVGKLQSWARSTPPAVFVKKSFIFLWPRSSPSSRLFLDSEE